METRSIPRPALLERAGHSLAALLPWYVPPRPWYRSQRLIGLLLLAALSAAMLAYMVVEVPIVGPKLSRADATRYWAAAALGAAAVAAYALLIVAIAIHDSRAGLRPSKPVPRPKPGSGFSVPRPLRFERVPHAAVALAAAISLTGVAIATLTASQLWIGGLCLIAPWAPIVAVEARWKWATYGIFGGFALVVLLQLLHMGEHSTQVGQLAVSSGDLASSHGVFGQLDFELVHFVTDTTLWLTLGLFVLVFPSGNKWLWIAFAAASLHQVEHFYLFWIYHAHHDVYLSGGFAGIMGDAGMIGTPLDRPYLHFTYNLIVFVPMTIALWDEARRVGRRKR